MNFGHEIEWVVGRLRTNKSRERRERRIAPGSDDELKAFRCWGRPLSS